MLHPKISLLQTSNRKKYSIKIANLTAQFIRATRSKSQDCSRRNISSEKVAVAEDFENKITVNKRENAKRNWLFKCRCFSGSNI